MNDLLNNRRFCDDATRDILSDRDLAALCSQTARAARRRLTTNRIKLATAAVTVAFAAYLTTFPSKAPESNNVAGRAAPRAPLAHTEIATQPFANIIATEPLRSDSFFAAIDSASLLQTPAAPTYRLISDDELMRLLDGHAVAFLRKPNGRLHLEFLGQNLVQ